jgi:hypothetical protein
MGCSASQEDLHDSNQPAVNNNKRKSTNAKPPPASSSQENGLSVEDISINNSNSNSNQTTKNKHVSINMKKTPPPGTPAAATTVSNNKDVSKEKEPASPKGSRPMSMSFSKSFATSHSAKFIKKTNKESPLISLDVSDKMKLLPMEGSRYHYDLNYCYCSQRGYYPRALDKANQDSYLIGENILDNNTCHVFGIFDGHGEVGDLCAFYAADRVSQSDCLLVSDINISICWHNTKDISSHFI